MTTLRNLPIVLLGLLAVGLVLVGLSVEAFTRSEVTRAQRALTKGALARTVASEDVTPQVRGALAKARRHVNRRQFGRVALQLDALTDETPTRELHHLAALAWQAVDRGEEAARHTQLAARLAPEDAAQGARADRAVNVALAYRGRPYTRTVGAGALLVLLVLGVRGARIRWARRELRRFLDDVTGRMAFTVDGDPQGSTPRLRPDTESLTIDVFLKGRYGMACPTRPARAPTLHVSLSHAGASRTVRLTPVKRLRDSAVRIPVRPETLRRLLDVPGRWRVHARLGQRPLATAVLEARSARAQPSISRQNDALKA